MSKLRDEIRHLMKLAASLPDPRPETAPPGFAARVVARARVAAAPSLDLMRRALAFVSWTAAAVIAVSGGVLWPRPGAGDFAGHVLAAARYVAEALSP